MRDETQVAHVVPWARRLAAYLPVTLARQILRGEPPTPGEPRQIRAATLFADISGFTAMSEELATDGPRGAEELSRVLEDTFTPLIAIIHEAGGAVSHFHGDAMTVYFPEEGTTNAARRALVCAQKMQSLMWTQLSQAQTERPPGKPSTFPLTLKIGVGYGECLEMVVGDPETHAEFVLAGAGVDDAVNAEKQASARQVIASAALMREVGSPATRDFQPWVHPLPALPALPLLDWSHFSEADHARLAQAAPAFLPAALVQGLNFGPHLSLAEHRPVTSLFVQFGGLDYADAAAGALLQRYFAWAEEIVARYGGASAYLNRVLIGDKGSQLHIMFGAPVAPDAPERAVRCALALQREKPDFITRQQVGLAAGKVFAGPIGAESRREYTVVGDVVNLSARLMQLSEEGEVVVAEAAAHRAENVAVFAAMPSVKVKGKQIMIRPYRALRERPRPALGLDDARQARTIPLVGREAEMDLLLGSLDTALRGLGSVVAVSGGVGVGKTRLVVEGIAYWRAQGGTDYVAFCQSHMVDVPYGPWLEIWRAFFGLEAGMPASSQQERVRQQTEALFPEAGEDAALWGFVLGLGGEMPASLANLTAKARQVRFFDLVRGCFLGRARQQPLLLCFEDVHWVDRATLEMIDALTEEVHDVPFAVVLTMQAHHDAPAQAERPLAALLRPTCSRVPLADLPPRHASELLRHYIGDLELPPAVEQRLGLRDRDGQASPVNPMFLREAVQALEGMGVLRRGTRVTLDRDRLEGVQLPDTIHGLVLARLDRLPASTRYLAQIAAVIGRRFDLSLLQHLVGSTPGIHMAQQLAQLSHADIAQAVTAESTITHQFQHVMMREVAYESLPYAQRQELHTQIVSWLEATHAENLKPHYGVLAYHCGQAKLRQKGLTYAVGAADEARRIYANWEAIDLYTLAQNHLQALGVDDYADVAAHVGLSQGHIWLMFGEYERAEPLFAEALALARAHEAWGHLAHANNLLAELKFRQSKYGEIVNYTQPVKALAERITVDDLALAYLWDGWAAANAGNYSEALQEVDEAVRLCQQVGSQHRLALALEASAFIYYSQRQLDKAIDALSKGVRLARAFSVTVNVGYTLNNLAWCQFEAGHATKALETLNEAALLAQKAGRNLLAIVLANRGGIHGYLGAYDAAAADLRRAVDMLEDMDDDYTLVEAHLQWGHNLAAAQEMWDEAAYHLEQAQSLIGSRTRQYAVEHTRVLIGLAQVALAQGRNAEARTLLDQAEAGAINISWWRPAVAYFQGVAARQKGDKARAVAHFSVGRRLVEEQGCPDYLPLLLLELARLEEDPARRKTYLEQCLSATQRAHAADRERCEREATHLLSLHEE